MRARSTSVTKLGESRLAILMATVLCSAGLLCAGIASAEDGPRCEVGTSVGVTIVSSAGGGDSQTHFGIPGGIGPLSPFSPAIHVTVFVTPSVMLEPQLSVSALSLGGSTATFFTLVGQVGFLFMPESPGSPYLAAGGAIQNASEGGSSVSGTAVGGEAGYRFKAGDSAALRLKLNYRRWLGDFDQVNEVGVGLGLGLVF